MRIRKVALTVTGVMMVLGGLVGVAGAAPPALANGCSAGNLNDYHNGYGWYLNNQRGTWYVGGASGNDICLLPGAGSDGYFYLQHEGTNNCLTWDNISNTIYDSTCGAHNAAQTWGYNGTVEIWNFYGGAFQNCLAGNTAGHPAYLYTCAYPVDNAQSWTKVSS